MTIGQLVADNSVAVRKKFGRFPPVERSWNPVKQEIISTPCRPLPGHERDVIEPLPDFAKMSKVEKAYTPQNRAHYRTVMRRFLPRVSRKKNYSRDLHERVNVTRKEGYDDGDVSDDNSAV